MIKGGYYIKARQIQESDIAFAPPHVREIWDWLLKEANHTDIKNIKRGQTVRTYSDIQEGLHWMIGYRKEKYSKWQCEGAMKWLTKHDMITTMKTTRGLLITICNYDIYQEPKNYESHTITDTRATMKPQPPDTINKKEKNVKNKEQYMAWYSESENDNYKYLINFILGDNVTGAPLENILSMDNQITEEAFLNLHASALENGTRISQKLISLESKLSERGGKKYVDLVKTLGNWVQNKFKK